MKEIPHLELKEETEGIVVIMDVSTAENPKIISSIPLPEKPTLYNNIVVRDKRIILTSSYGVHIIDVENPNEPERIADLPLKGARNISLVGKYAFILSNIGLYAALDVENPTELLRISHDGSERRPMFSGKAFQVKDEYVYFIDRDSHVRVSKLIRDQNNVLGIKLASELNCTWRFPFFLVQGQDVKPVLDKLSLRKSLLSKNIPAEIRGQLSDRANLLSMQVPREFKAEISEYICLWFSQPVDRFKYSKHWLKRLCKRLWIIPPENNMIYPFDLPIEYTKYLYLSGRRELPGASITSVDRMIVFLKFGIPQLVFISRDNWTRTVDVDLNIVSMVTDFKLSGDYVYIITEDGKFLVVKLLPQGPFEIIPNVVGLYRQDPSEMVSAFDLSHCPQSMALDKNSVYILCSIEKRTYSQRNEAIRHP